MTTPIVIEIGVGDGVIRGHEYTADGPPVVLVHEPGRDLDAWSPFAAWFANKGLKVIALDLPGHGLSDGDPGDWEPMAHKAIDEIRSQWGPIGIATAGAACALLPRYGSDDGVPVQAMISPTPMDINSLRTSNWGIRLIMCGPGDKRSHTDAKLVFDNLRGEKMMVTGGGADQGTELIRAHRHLAEELVMWFRRYLMPYHLSWIKEVTEAKTKDVAEERSTS